MSPDPDVQAVKGGPSEADDAIHLRNPDDSSLTLCGQYAPGVMNVVDLPERPDGVSGCWACLQRADEIAVAEARIRADERQKVVQEVVEWLRARDASNARRGLWNTTPRDWSRTSSPASSEEGQPMPSDRKAKLVKVGRWQPAMTVGVGCDQCRGRGYYMGGGGGALKCPRCPTAMEPTHAE
jgi:hypothetical protein